MRRHLLERWKPAAAVALTAALFTPLLVLGGPAFARTGAAASQYEYGGSAQYQYNGKLTICHLTRSKKHPGHTIRIAPAAWKAHSRHGDHLGPCTGTESPRPKLHGHFSDTVQAHGKSGEAHGKSGEHGNHD